ncbi:hypothetical protein CH275_17385 [Rhodococcus sp. 06-235-1A]|uniref:DUF6188 family protein n=1 Tax=Rhodococcus sp. 06-235-1A TaxID=2022508 RepID=UPI000B9B7C2F|nr:DUF6188 family protein [Rhodococcus sp. 06-235-1A]OZD02409.1 hypothetical protein CH275_17385 [Rhodococcus sp. 06-235-1A]
MELPLNGHTIASVEFGYSLALRTNHDYEVRIESSFQLDDDGADGFRGAPESMLTDNIDVRRLEGRLVASAHASDDGDLRIEFADCASLMVSFDPDFEAWTVVAPEGFKAVSVAGGGLSVWN